MASPITPTFGALGATSGAKLCTAQGIHSSRPRYGSSASVCLRFRSALRDDGRVHLVRGVEVEESKHSTTGTLIDPPYDIAGSMIVRGERF